MFTSAYTPAACILRYGEMQNFEAIRFKLKIRKPSNRIPIAPTPLRRAITHFAKREKKGT
jgi:hypothetical protein